MFLLIVTLVFAAVTVEQVDSIGGWGGWGSLSKNKVEMEREKEAVKERKYHQTERKYHQMEKDSEVSWLRHLLYLLQLKAPARYISKRDAVFLKHVTGIYRPYIGFDLRYFNQV